VPELPEVETIVRCLRPCLLGLRIKDVRLRCRKLLRNSSPAVLVRLKGQQIIGLRRRGKMILLDLAAGHTLVFHLKMTGQLLFCSHPKPYDKHTHVIISFRQSRADLRFRDIRKFGFVLVAGTSEVEGAAELRNLGPEPLGLGLPAFRELLRGRRGRIKPLLLNQSFVAGIGNIYADEILFEARIHPESDVSRLGERELHRLWNALQLVLKRAVKFRGTSIRDYRDSDGREGNYQDRLHVYGRAPRPCPRCGRRLERTRIAGRSSSYCPSCQRRP
jgi:formamidopyrimidine-DNA glycosylase